jgi:hypothetical protein
MAKLTKRVVDAANALGFIWDEQLKGVVAIIEVLAAERPHRDSATTLITQGIHGSRPSSRGSQAAHFGKRIARATRLAGAVMRHDDDALIASTSAVTASRSARSWSRAEVAASRSARSWSRSARSWSRAAMTASRSARSWSRAEVACSSCSESHLADGLMRSAEFVASISVRQPYRIRLSCKALSA